MFLQIAIGAIGIGIVLMVGYLIIAQVKSALVSSGAATPTYTVSNPCYNMTADYAAANSTACVNTCSATWVNTSTTVGCTDYNVSQVMNRTQATIFAGFALIAVGVIVLAAFGLINVFQ